MSSLKTLEYELYFRESARRNLADFVMYTYPTYQMGLFHKYMCQILQQFYADVIAGKRPRVMVFAPPRHGKSELVSRRFPAWVLGKSPDIAFIAASYNTTLASKMNRDVQFIIEDDPYRQLFPATVLPTKGSRQERNSDNFEIASRKGVYRSAGVGSGITGMGADILVIDDPVKDGADAASMTIRESTYEWYRSTAYTRLSPIGGVLLTMTRWHLDDLGGKLLADMAQNSGDAWTIIKFPAVAEEDEFVTLDNKDIVFRKKGEPLHADRFDLEQLAQKQAILGSYIWNSLYQQTPVAEGGNIFKRSWFKFYEPTTAPRCEYYIGSWDMTFKGNEDSDYVVGQIWGKKGADFYLIDQYRAKTGFVGTLEAVKEMYRKYPTCVAWLVEDKANGTAIIELLKMSIPGVLAITPHESKIARAHAISPLCEAGNIHLPYPHNMKWVDTFIDEVCNFPTDKHDDQVDCLTQSLNYLRTASMSVWERLGGRNRVA